MNTISDCLFICLDSEATGLDIDHDKVIEIGVNVFDIQHTICTFSILIKTVMPADNESHKIHHISNEMLKKAATFPEALLLIQQLFDTFKPHAIVGHFLDFDINIISNNARTMECNVAWLHKQTHFDTLKLARSFLPDQYNFSLSSLCKYLDIDTEPTHRALEDAIATSNIFVKLLSVANLNSFAEICDIMSQPCKVQKMPFGKHKGTNIADVPHHYLSFVYNNMHLDKDLSFSIYEVLQKR